MKYTKFIAAILVTTSVLVAVPTSVMAADKKNAKTSFYQFQKKLRNFFMYPIDRIIGIALVSRFAARRT